MHCPEGTVLGVPNNNIVSHRSRPACRADPHPCREDSGLLDRVEGLLAQGGEVRMEGNDLVVSPLEAKQKPERNVELERLIDERLPFVELSELLIEVDGWTHFSDDFEHAGGTEPRNRELRRHLYAG